VRLGIKNGRSQDRELPVSLVGISGFSSGIDAVQRRVLKQ
jgi:hypothetical protein